MERKLTREEILIFIKNNLLVVLGTIILAFGTGIFLLPFDLVTGGVSGIANPEICAVSKIGTVGVNRKFIKIAQLDKTIVTIPDSFLKHNVIHRYRHLTIR